jgi:hypothetical protein
MARSGRKRKSNKKPSKLRGLSPRANYTDRATTACRRSQCQLLWIEGATCDGFLRPYSRLSRPGERTNGNKMMDDVEKTKRGRRKRNRTKKN